MTLTPPPAPKYQSPGGPGTYETPASGAPPSGTSRSLIAVSQPDSNDRTPVDPSASDVPPTAVTSASEAGKSTVGVPELFVDSSPLSPEAKNIPIPLRPP